MKKNFLPEGMSFYKANMHSHSTLSDGRFTPEEIKEHYKAMGYSVVAYTDHDFFTTHNDLTDDSFLALNAQEAQIDEETGHSSWNKTYHLNFYAKSPDITTCPAFAEDRHWVSKKEKLKITEEARANYTHCDYSQKSINHLIQVANEQGFFVSYNHPVWSLQNYADYGELTGLWGVEVFNTGCVLDALPDTTVPFDDLLKQGKNVFPLCTDDNHMQKEEGGGWLMIAAPSLTYENIVDALMKGNFYASTGPKIYAFSYENGTFHIETDKAARITLITDWRKGKIFLPEDGKTFITSLDYTPTTLWKKYNATSYPGAENSYFRLEVTGLDGTVAYTRAIRMSEVEENK